ncbi:hypothetical protein [Peterkaempfera sp. SMS 1(5)a]|uniref:hypothetical protein n=1 Tax=Peterkaempfera podocarpi TaxID=3232308 RepID=UPI0036706B09
MLAYDPEHVGPELPVPLVPLTGVQGVLQRRILSPRGPDFAAAQRRTAAWAAVACGLTAAAALLPSAARWGGLSCASLVALVAVARVWVLVRAQRLQTAFELRWREAQTAVLRGHCFEILRLTVRDSDDIPGGWLGYDLNRLDQLRELLVRRARSLTERPLAQVRIEFAYWSTPGTTMAVAEVRRNLADLEVLAEPSGSACASVRLPEARYATAPDAAGRPASFARWELTGQVVVGPAGPGQGFGSAVGTGVGAGAGGGG